MKDLIVFITIFILQATADYMKATSLSFDISKCTQISDGNQSHLGCQLNGFLGEPQQSQTYLVVFSSPFQFSIGDYSNAIVNSRCNKNNDCQYAVYAPDYGKNFYQEYASASMEELGGGYNRTQYDIVQFQGDYESDIVHFFQDDEGIRMDFISINVLEINSYMGNGIIDLSRGNQNNIFKAGYLQNKLQSPKFQISYNLKNGLLNFNEFDGETNDAPSMKTFSDSVWDVQIAGFTVGDVDVLLQSHFQTFQIYLNQYPLLPYNIAQQLTKRFPQYFIQGDNGSSSGVYWNLWNCDNCDCVDEFGDVTIYTSEYYFAIPFSDFTYEITNNSGTGPTCGIYIASKQFQFGLNQIIGTKVTFNPLDGSLQFPGAPRMIHPSIDQFYVIFGLATGQLAILLIFVISLETRLNSLKDEFRVFKKYL